MMLPGKRILPVLILTAFFSSCISMKINDNSYRSLTQDELGALKQFSITETDAVRAQKDHFSLVEITGPDISKCLQKYPYTLVYLWKPYCKGENCKPLFYYERIDRRFRAKSVKLLMVSETYEYRLIKGNTERSTFDRDLYVIKDLEYGHNHSQAEKKIIKEITRPEDRKKGAGRYLVFKKDNLIYRGSEISERIMDSILSKN